MSRFGAIESFLDRLIGVFSPGREIRRRYFRKRLEHVRSAKYAAAKTNRMTGPWSPVDSNVNDIIGASSAAIRARVRQLVRDFPYFARAVSIVPDYMVGSGIIYQSRIRDPKGQLDKSLIQKTEDAFNFWADQADIAGKLHYYEMMHLAKRQDLEAGEFLIVKTLLNDRNRYLPYALQMFEADWLTESGATVSDNTNELSQGIEYKKSTGQIVAYHFTDPDSWGKPIRIPAERVIHGFQTLRPGQLRGISVFTAAILVAKDLSDYMDAEIDAAKMAAKYLSFVQTPDPYSRQVGVVTTDTDTNQKIEEMENAIIEYLRPGEEVTIASNPRPGTNFPPFVKLILRMVAITGGLPYELLSGDYEGFNYSTGRTSRNDFSHQLKPVATRHIRHFAQKTMMPFMDAAVLAGKLDFPGYFTNPAPFLRCEWQPPGMESIDPLRESKARIDEINALIRSPQEIVKSRGRDLEEVYKEIKAAKDLAEEYGLTVEEVSTALANNPAAINGDGDDTKAMIIDLIDKLEAAN